MPCEMTSSSIFQNAVFQTVIGGLLLFIFSQYLLEGLIKPWVELKKLKASLSEKLLVYQPKITNGNLNIEEIKEIKDTSSKLLSYAWTFSYRKATKLQFVDISQKINGLVGASQTGDKADIPYTIQCLNDLKKYKFLKVTFE